MLQTFLIALGYVFTKGSDAYEDMLVVKDHQPHDYPDKLIDIKDMLNSRCELCVNKNYTFFDNFIARICIVTDNLRKKSNKCFLGNRDVPYLQDVISSLSEGIIDTRALLWFYRRFHEYILDSKNGGIDKNYLDIHFSDKLDILCPEEIGKILSKCINDDILRPVFYDFIKKLKSEINEAKNKFTPQIKKHLIEKLRCDKNGRINIDNYILNYELYVYAAQKLLEFFEKKIAIAVENDDKMKNFDVLFLRYALESNPSVIYTDVEIYDKVSEKSLVNQNLENNASKKQEEEEENGHNEEEEDGDNEEEGDEDNEEEEDGDNEEEENGHNEEERKNANGCSSMNQQGEEHNLMSPQIRSGPTSIPSERPSVLDPQYSNLGASLGNHSLESNQRRYPIPSAIAPTNNVPYDTTDIQN
ncbi:hypothetical protein TCON_1526 [Astathelohania contejeani]|uniref:Uncharacterized protein n=1 Tax=Astathelohania contejeani TaxID=164912 RepID=A0ABQ7HYL6_9MICR|nr:hypothetical protein TCON_1526 [Thelohania contejeani]